MCAALLGNGGNKKEKSNRFARYLGAWQSTTVTMNGAQAGPICTHRKWWAKEPSMQHNIFFVSKRRFRCAFTRRHSHERPLSTGLHHIVPYRAYVPCGIFARLYSPFMHDLRATAIPIHWQIASDAFYRRKLLASVYTPSHQIEEKLRKFCAKKFHNVE